MDPTESHCSPKALCNEAIGARSIKVWQARGKVCQQHQLSPKSKLVPDKS